MRSISVLLSVVADSVARASIVRIALPVIWMVWVTAKLAVEPSPAETLT
jgi:hypothetical protein